MRIPALLLIPFAAALLTFAVRTPRVVRIRLAVLIGAAAAHAALVASLWISPAPASFAGWLAVDALGLVVLTLTSVLFLLISVYAVGYLRYRRPRGGRMFVSGLLSFLGAASVVALSQHLALLWVGIETTTLSLAPLIFHRHDRRSLEAVWKYLVISSVGIAVALLGIFFLATAQTGLPGRPLVLGDLLRTAPALRPDWLRAAFLLLLVGFGTKMGLAPMHTWKPDTYGEAPSIVSALMAGALTSCAFLGVARITQISIAAGLGDFIRPVLLGFGLLSLALAALFIIGQSDVKRLLAWSSIEHMGLLVIGLGLGGVGSYGSVLHMLNNGMAKSWLFLIVGNIALVSGTSVAASNRGVVRTLPISGPLFVLGLFAVTGAPPFGLFISELTILRAAIGTGHPWIAAATLLLLGVIFVGMAAMMLEMGLGEAQPGAEARRESGWLIAGPLALAALVLLLGLHIPHALHDLLSGAAASLGGQAP